MALDDVKLARLRALAEQGLPTRRIAREIGISKSYAHQLVTKHAKNVAVKFERGILPTEEAGRFILANAGRLSDAQMAEACGVTRHQVRTFRSKHKVAALRRNVRIDRGQAAPASRFVAANDRELIDQFLSSKGATVCPPGTACGLSAVERLLYAAKPPSKNRTDWISRKASRAAK